MQKLYSLSDILIKLKNSLDLTNEEIAQIFHLSEDDLKSLELGLMPLDYSNFKTRVLKFKELIEFLERKLQSEQNLAKLFKTPSRALGNRSALEILIKPYKGQSFFDVTGFFYRSFK